MLGHVSYIGDLDIALLHPRGALKEKESDRSTRLPGPRQGKAVPAVSSRRGEGLLFWSPLLVRSPFAPEFVHPPGQCRFSVCPGIGRFWSGSNLALSLFGSGFCPGVFVWSPLVWALQGLSFSFVGSLKHVLYRVSTFRLWSPSVPPLCVPFDRWCKVSASSFWAAQNIIVGSQLLACGPLPCLCTGTAL
jgi:hypothetical protein